MKSINVFRRVLFISTLCLLWLPNYCDIKPHDESGSQQPAPAPTLFGETENVSARQEEESLRIEDQSPVDVIVQPNVEYVNSVDSQKADEKIVNAISDVPEFHDKLSSNDEKSDIPSTNEESSDSKANSFSKRTISEREPETVIAPVPLPVEVSVKAASPDIHPYDGMPSFDEWKKMMLAEQRKGGQKVPSPPGLAKKLTPKRRRNYASTECGAKIAASNAEAEGAGRILNEQVDEYMLNPCTASIWTVVELCETVQANQIELANFELFSSSPREFSVSSSDHFPTREWRPLGTFQAAEVRALQSFPLKQEGFGKFIKIELLSHYGKEHYCPLSVVRIFGNTMVDEYEEMETMEAHDNQPMDDEADRLDISVEDKKSSNLFGSATDAVMNIVKKAAQALGQRNANEGEKNETLQEQHNISDVKLCGNGGDLSTPFNFTSLSPTAHRTLYGLLHQCDQCTRTGTRLRYYSPAQPTRCRFFQAAMGSVLYRALCDWFQQHPVVIPQESSAHRVVPLSHLSPTDSPPPQILIVPHKQPWTIPIDKRRLQDNSTVDPVVEKPENIHVEGSVQINDPLPQTDQPTHFLNLTDPSTTNQAIPPSSPSFPTAAEVQPSTAESAARPSPNAAEEKTLTLDGSDSSSGEPNITEEVSVTTNGAEEELELMTNGEEMGMTEGPPDVKEEKPTTPQMKESVFMRLSNRIKSLELNMSLSSQYLQELSQRYRRQMDEMQRAFNRTVATLNETAHRAALRDFRQQEMLNSLQVKVQNLTQVVEGLLNERAALFRQMLETHIVIMAIEAIVMVTVMSLCVRRVTRPNALTTNAMDAHNAASTQRLAKRRSSVDAFAATPPPHKVKKRSASEEALCNAVDEIVIVEPLPVLIDPILKVKKKNRKRKGGGVQRSSSHPSVAQTHPSRKITPKTAHSDGNVNHLSAKQRPNDENKRPKQQPLRNIGNGHVPNGVGKDKFSFRKFLRLPKRDSI